MMENKKLQKLINFLYWFSILFAGIVLAKTYVDKSKVPAGVCTINQNKGLMITSITILLVVVAITWIIEYKSKKKEKSV